MGIRGGDCGFGISLLFDGLPSYLEYIEYLIVMT